mmetsp:Transcript_17840/g.23094  ORF Transcript_17840/g.23094 Transcript_17840/m.23094 type:complete len:339 (+) Transcript_17840:90-1106(+)|eukprot:CAMPEP_0198144158 /NCGR_PEP_ID=MMETSP1443-20131203/13634_1 /TAXON_ID=186043 /ORGANISM="Entomoneis sp., Strain CCMP2396" /LENGTH=338 /DNA_ID=CAMNT_0043807509 /DNA_START=1 /DNA_END=1017 /DNA_ORIENTATION=-
MEESGDLLSSYAEGEAPPKTEQMDREMFDQGRIVTPDPILDTSFPGCFAAAPTAVQAANCVCLPFYLLACCGWFTLTERKHVAVLYCGQYAGSVDTPGLHCLPPLCMEMRPISTSTRTMDMKDLKIVDQRGNPVIVSAVVTFVATSARKARIDVENPWPGASWNPHVTRGTFLQLQAQAVLKQVASMFPYEAPPGFPSLQTEGAHITELLVKKLQDRVSVTGARIFTFDLVDLSYAPEIAQSMLLRQQAAALVDARSLIVHASVNMVHDAMELLEEKNITLGPKAKEGIVSNLLTVICSHSGVTPTVNVGGESSSSSAQQEEVLDNILRRQQAMTNVE